MKIFIPLILFPFAVSSAPLWHCESMDIHRFEHIRLGGDHIVKKGEQVHHRSPIQDDTTAACQPVCKSIGCPETASICWTDDPVTGKTIAGKRYIECE